MNAEIAGCIKEPEEEESLNLELKRLQSEISSIQFEQVDLSLLLSDQDKAIQKLDRRLRALENQDLETILIGL